MSSRELRNTLCDLYDDLDKTKLIAEDAGIELGRINLTGTVETAWREILKEAGKQGLVADIISIALEEYPDNKILIAYPNGNGPAPKPVPEPESTTSKKIFFSYAWGDQNEKGESREKIVDELYESLKDDGFEVVRDKKDLGYGGLISGFMKDIGEGSLIIVFISDKYLKSQYCMFELLEIFRNSRGDKEQFAKAIMPVSVEYVKLSDTEVLDQYFEHWAVETKKWEDLVAKRKSQVTESQTDQWQRMKKINQNFGDLADFLRDINSSTVNLLKENDFQIVKDEITKRLKD